MAAAADFVEARIAYHASLLKNLLSIDEDGVASNADKHSPISVNIAHGIAQRLKSEVGAKRQAGQTSGSRFEDACAEFVRNTFSKLGISDQEHGTFTKLAAVIAWQLPSTSSTRI